MSVRQLISRRDWILTITIGALMTLAAFWLADTSSSERAALVLLGPGFLLQKLAGLGGHDEGGFLLLLLGNFGFYVGLCVVALILVKIAKRRKRIE